MKKKINRKPKTLKPWLPDSEKDSKAEQRRYASGVKDERIKRKLEKILRLPAFDFPALGKERGGVES